MSSVGDILFIFNKFDSGFEATKDNCTVESFGEGHIHATYCLTNKVMGKKYIFQRLNTIFDIKAIDHNLQLFERTQSIAESKGFLPTYWKTLSYLNVKGTTNKIYYDENGVAYRVMNYVPGEIQIFNPFNQIPLEDQEDAARSLGEAVAIFRKMLEFVPLEPWKEPLPNFHNLTYHLNYLDSVLRYEEVVLSLSQDTSRKARRRDDIIREYPNGPDRVNNLLRKIQERRNKIVPLDWLETVVTHGDLFVNNAVYIRNKQTKKLECVCFIDLDTIQRGNELTDLGQALYSVGNPAGEEPKKLDDVKISKEIVLNVINGYLKKISEFYGEKKFEQLRRYVLKAYQLSVYEELIRYFADALVGNEYYKVSHGTRKDINLYRAEVLIRVLEELDEVLPELESILGIKW